MNWGEDKYKNPTGLRYHSDLLLTIPKLLGISGVTTLGDSRFVKGTLDELVLA